MDIFHVWASSVHRDKLVYLFRCFHLLFNQDLLDKDLHPHSKVPKPYSAVAKIREALNLMRKQFFEVCIVQILVIVFPLTFLPFLNQRLKKFELVFLGGIAV